MVTILENQEDKILAFRVNGKISKEEIDELGVMLEDKLKFHKKINIYAEIKNLEGYSSIDALFTDLKLTLKHFTDVEKVAIVTEDKWIENLAHVTDNIIGSDVRHFHMSQEPEAIEWVNI